MATTEIPDRTLPRHPIVTSSWFTPLPDHHIRIGISRGTPRHIARGYRRYPALNPGPWFRSVSPEDYERLYYEEVLSRLDPSGVVADLRAMAGDGVAVLVCFEKPPPDDQWCHRALVSAWLLDELGLAVPELGHEQLGVGHQHPKHVKRCAELGAPQSIGP